MKCKICNIEQNRLGWHLRAHKIDPQDYYDIYLKKDGEGICKTCGKPTKFMGVTRGYRDFCSEKCAVNNKDVKERIAETNIRKYGSENPFGSKKVQKKIKKTNLERYGAKNPMQCQDIQDKAKKTNLEKYGVDNPLKNKEIQDKVRNTNMERRGVPYPMQSKEVMDKSIETNMERYGVPYSTQNPEVRAKAIQTNMKKYGAPNPMQSDDVRNKAKDTNMKRYGVENPMQVPEVKEKLKNTFIELYGIDNPMKDSDIRNKAVLTNLERYGTRNSAQSEIIKQQIEDDLNRFEHDNNCVSIRKIMMECGAMSYHALYNSQIPTIIYKNRLFISNDYIDRLNNIIKDMNSNRSSFETSIYEYIKSIYSGKIIRNGRKFLGNFELDLLLPGEKLAIECNGIYYHSTQFGRDSDYHLGKSKLCLDKNVRLIHILESDWINNPEVCKNLIKKSLNHQQYTKSDINLELQPVEGKIASNFLNNKSLKMYINSNNNYGIYSNNRLVGVFSCIGKDSTLKIANYFIDPEYNEYIDLVELIKGKFTGVDSIYLGLDFGTDNFKKYLGNGWEISSITKPSPIYVYYKKSRENSPGGYVKTLKRPQEECTFFEVYNSGAIILKYDNI